VASRCKGSNNHSTERPHHVFGSWHARTSLPSSGKRQNVERPAKRGTTVPDTGPTIGVVRSSAIDCTDLCASYVSRHDRL